MRFGVFDYVVMDKVDKVWGGLPPPISELVDFGRQKATNIQIDFTNFWYFTNRFWARFLKFFSSQVAVGRTCRWKILTFKMIRNFTALLPIELKPFDCGGPSTCMLNFWYSTQIKRVNRFLKSTFHQLLYRCRYKMDEPMIFLANLSVVCLWR